MNHRLRVLNRRVMTRPGLSTEFNRPGYMPMIW